MKHHHIDRDHGYTLTELLVSIVLIGLLSGVLVGVFSVVIRSVPDVDATTDAARTLQGVVTWLPQDVDSTPPTGFSTAPSATSGCTVSPGTSLLRMEWTENVGTPIRYISNYRAVPVSSTAMRIERITCSGAGSSPLGNSFAQPVSADLPRLPVGWLPGQLPVRVSITTDPGGDVVLVAFEVQTLEGKIVRTDSAPKNPSNTLTPTSVVATPTSIATTTTSTTTTTTTTLPSGPTTTDPSGTTSTTTTPPATTTTTLPPCGVTSVSLSPTFMRNTDPNGNGKSGINGVGVLQDPVTVTVQTNGWCGSVEARSDTGAANGELFRNSNPGLGPTFTITLPGYGNGSSELWRDGNRVVRIYGPKGSTVLGSVTLEVR